MEQEGLKQKAIKGMIWSLCERFGSLLILFISNIILARLLSPDDFGVIGILMSIVLFLNILVDGGLSSAIIQRKNVTNIDLTTVFYLNIGIAAACYAAIFLSAEWLARFYGHSELDLLLKVMGLIVITDAIGATQNSYLIKQLNFKRIAVIKILAALISTVVAVYLAYDGFGVWSLALQYIINSVLKSAMLWTASKWFPSFTFSKDAFKSMFGYGSFLLIANLLSEGYRNFQVLILGRFFPVSEVGYFSQAKHLQDVPVVTIFTVINQVTFPVFSKLQDEKDKLVAGIRRSLKIITFLNFPLMLCLTVVAEPLITFLFTDKWLPSVPYFQWLCAGFGLLLVIHNTNLNAIKSVGRSDIVLILEVVKKALGIGMIFAFIYLGYGAISILWALAINSFIEFFLNGFFTGKLVGYGIFKQVKDILPNLLLSLAVAAIVSVIPHLADMSALLLLIIELVGFVALYILGAKILKFEPFNYLLETVKTQLKKK